MKVKSLSRLRLFATPWTVTYQAPPSMGFSRQEYWSGLPFPSPGDLPDPGIEPGSPTLQADPLTSEPPGKAPNYLYWVWQSEESEPRVEPEDPWIRRKVKEADPQSCVWLPSSEQPKSSLHLEKLVECSSHLILSILDLLFGLCFSLPLHPSCCFFFLRNFGYNHVKIRVRSTGQAVLVYYIWVWSLILVLG